MLLIHYKALKNVIKNPLANEEFLDYKSHFGAHTCRTRKFDYPVRTVACIK